MDSRVLGVAVALLIMNPHSSHLGAHQPSMVYGPGTQSCGSWTKAKERSNSEALVMQSWILGYVTGASAVMEAVAKLPIAPTDSAGVLGWTSKYCSDNPLDSLPRAAASLVVELRNRVKTP